MLQGIHFLFAILVCLARMNKGTLVTQNGKCVIEDYSVICETNLPRMLPENITSVKVEELLHDTINNDTFEHNSWRTVYHLDVTVNSNVYFRLHDYNFFALKNLRSLGIHSAKLTFGGNKDVFNGLLKLRYLNLSSCYQLTSTELINNLETTQTSVDSLILNHFSTFYGGQIIFNNVFMEMISKLKVRKLSLSGCNILFKGPMILENLSYSFNDLDLSNTTVTDTLTSSDSRQFIAVLSKLKRLSISHIPSRFISFRYWVLLQERIDPYCSENFNDTYYYLYWQIERVEMNHVLSRTVIFNNSFMDLSECNINLKSWHLRSNNIHYFNLTVQWPDELSLSEIDLSLNDLEYLSPSVFGSVLSMEKIHLAHNKLNFMTSFIEFKFLLSTFKKLLYIDLSNNQLSWLPTKIFANNLNLASLDLSHNQLSSVSFDIQHLTNLRLFNMENNKVHYIDGADLASLNLLMQKMPIPVNITFDHNPIICSCESVNFVTSLSFYAKTTGIPNYVCSLDGQNVPLDNDAIEKSKFLCIRSKIVIGSVTTGILTLFVISVVTVFVIYRNRQQRRARNKANFLENFKKGLLQQKFLCFLSYSSEDEGRDICYIYEHLRDTLMKSTGIERETVCLGNKNFKLGFPVVDEILRCISESCVVVCIVSNNFCESHWCKHELREAYELNKPIIIICKGEINLKLMPPFMSSIFRKFTRAKLVTNKDGQSEIVPDLKQLSSSILQLAAM